MESRGNANTGQPPRLSEVLALGLKVDPTVNDSELFLLCVRERTFRARQENQNLTGKSSAESVHVVFLCRVQGVCQSCDINYNLLNYHKVQRGM